MSNYLIKLTHPNNRIYEKSNRDFWLPFYEAADQVKGEYASRENQDRLKGRIKMNFPHELKKYLANFTPDLPTITPNVKKSLAASIAIAVDDVREGSLEIGMIIEPVEKLSKLFENNFQYFEVFMKSYIPIALLESLRPASSSNYLGWADVINQLQIETIPTDNFRSRFNNNEQTVATEAVSASGLRSRANWLWIISNTTLVIPVAIAGIALYFSFQRLTFKERILEEKVYRIIDQQNKLIESLSHKKAGESKSTDTLEVR